MYLPTKTAILHILSNVRQICNMSSRNLALQRIDIRITYDVIKVTKAYHELVNIYYLLLSKQLMLVVNLSRI